MEKKLEGSLLLEKIAETLLAWELYDRIGSHERARECKHKWDAWALALHHITGVHYVCRRREGNLVSVVGMYDDGDVLWSSEPYMHSDVDEVADRRSISGGEYVEISSETLEILSRIVAEENRCGDGRWTEPGFIDYLVRDYADSVR